MRQLAEGRNLSEIARREGLYNAAISDAMNKGQLPKADKAIRIARALGVSAEWLWDDARSWPPPSSGQPEAPAPDGILFIDVLSRARALRNRLAEINAQAESFVHSTPQSPERSPQPSPPQEMVVFLRIIRDFMVWVPSLAAWNNFSKELTSIDWDSAMTTLKPLWKLLGQRYGEIHQDDDRQVAVREALRTGNLASVSDIIEALGESAAAGHPQRTAASRSTSLSPDTPQPSPTLRRQADPNQLNEQWSAPPIEHPRGMETPIPPTRTSAESVKPSPARPRGKRSTGRRGVKRK